MRVCIAVSLLLATVAANAPLALKAPFAPPYFRYARPEPDFKWSVHIDGKPIPLENLEWQANDLVVDLKELIRQLTKNRGKVEKQGDRYVISLDGQKTAVIPAGSRPVATLVYGDGAEDIRREPYDDQVSEVKISDKLVTGTNLESFCRLMGISVFSHGRTIQLYTPGYWYDVLVSGPEAAQSDVIDRVQRLRESLKLMPEFGISPPANSFLVWVRPPTVGGRAGSSTSPAERFVQVYEVRDASIPLLAGNDGVAPTPAFQDMALVKGGELLQVHQSADEVRGDFAPYIAVVTRTKPDKNVVKAIRDGRLKGTDVCVVGIQQEIRGNRALFDFATLSADAKVASLIEKHDMDEGLFRYFNGLDNETALKKGTSIVFIAQDPDIDEALLEASLKESDIEGFYAMQPGETIESLAKALRTTVDRLYLLNDDILIPGFEPGAGTVLTIPKVTEPPKEMKIYKDDRLFIPKKDSQIFKSPDVKSEVLFTFSAEGSVPLLGASEDKSWLRVRTDDGKLGFMQASAGKIEDYANTEPVQIDVSNKRASQTVSAPGGVSARAVRAFKYGLAYVGTRYKLGGTSLTKGIDCSNFVSQIMRHKNGADIKGIWPPVHTMETAGDVVWVAPGRFHRGDRTHLSGPAGNLNNVKTGDRYIMIGTGRVPHHVSMHVGHIRVSTRNGVRIYKNSQIESCGSQGVTIRPATVNRSILRYVLRDPGLYR